MKKTLKNKTVLITGGTGSFGNAVLRRFLDSEFREIRIFSRDEKKQFDMLMLHTWDYEFHLFRAFCLLFDTDFKT